MTEPDKAMEEDRGKWRRLHHWILWWKVAPAERQAGSLFTSRLAGAALAVLVAVLTARVAFELMPYGPSLDVNPGQSMAGMCLAAFVLGWLTLGIFLLRGWRRAAGGLMALCTIEFLTVESMLIYIMYMDWGYTHTHAPAIRLALSCLALWTLSMHVYATLFRATRGEAGNA